MEKHIEIGKKKHELHIHTNSWALPFAVEKTEYVFFVGFLCFAFYYKLK